MLYKEDKRAQVFWGVTLALVRAKSYSTCACGIIVNNGEALSTNLRMCPLFISATRETAFIHAISSAAITHEFTHQCSQNKIPGCKCGKTRRQPKANSGWQWGGCSDDIKFGEKETRRFIDKLEEGKDARTAFNLHNNEVGRKVN